MNNKTVLTVLFLFLITPFAFAEGKEAYEMIDNIHWLGHDTFKIEGEKVIYTDPFQIRKGDAADIILITHDHRDHCSPEDVKKGPGP